MKKIEAVIQPSRLEPVKPAPHEIGAEGITVLEVHGHGRETGHSEITRGREYNLDLLPKLTIVITEAGASIGREGVQPATLASMARSISSFVENLNS